MIHMTWVAAVVVIVATVALPIFAVLIEIDRADTKSEDGDDQE
jgi:hypothetical protein